MATNIPVGYGLAALHFTGNVGTAPYVTTIGVDLNNAAGDFVACANGVKASFADAFENAWSSSLILDRVVLSVGQDGPGGSVEDTLGPFLSNRNGDFPPVAMSVIARKVTNELGRAGRGRMFLPGMVTEAQVAENGLIESVAVAAIEGNCEQFLDNLGSGMDALYPAMQPVLLHGPSVNPKPPTAIVSMTVAPIVGWIRGRIR